MDFGPNFLQRLLRYHLPYGGTCQKCLWFMERGITKKFNYLDKNISSHLLRFAAPEVFCYIENYLRLCLSKKISQGKNHDSLVFVFFSKLFRMFKGESHFLGKSISVDKVKPSVSD